MSQRDAILAKLRTHLPALRRRYPIAALGLFGSVARNEAGADSDLDIMVEFAAPLGLSQFLALENELSRLTGRNVDLVSRPALKAYIGRQVMRDLVSV
jgi:hypothetical protein